MHTKPKGLLMKARHALLLIAGSFSLSLGLGTPNMQAVAQAPAGTPDTTVPAQEPVAPPASATTLPAPIAPSFKTATTQRTDVPFADYADFKQLQDMYPEASQIIRDFGPGSQDDLLIPKAKVAKIGDDTILFSYENNKEWCGSLGCSILGFTRGTDGYYNSFFVTAGPDIKYAIIDNAPSIFLCNNDDQVVEWRRQDGDQFAPVPLPLTATRETCSTPEAQP